MTDEAKELQDRAVSKLVSLVAMKDEIVFKAPTGSGKTHMMADFMDRVLAANANVVFIVSSLSKAELAKQNYEAFSAYIDDGKFPSLSPYLISSEDETEGTLYIPTDYNVYVLPRDLYKNKSKLKSEASLLKFLNEIKGIGMGAGKDIYAIKDECHIATSNLDELKAPFFSKVINFSATPKTAKGQRPDIEIRENDAVQAHLIKDVVYGDDSDSLEDALEKFVEIKEAYQKSIHINPCMIIQISNKDKADEEIERIKATLNNNRFFNLKWMLILDNSAKKSETNDIIGIKKQPLNKWKYFAKLDHSTIDIIIFKMVISEGWDIRRACMLYQVRDSKSKQLDEQVIGRVKRNPRLMDFEMLDKDAQKLISTAYVWGIHKDVETTKKQTLLKGCEFDNVIQSEIRIQTTRLRPFEEQKTINIDNLALQPIDKNTPSSIFELYRKIQKTTVEVSSHYQSYVDTYNKFFVFTNNIDVINREVNNQCCDYSQNIVLRKDENDKECKSSFPYSSSCTATEHIKDIDSWIWRQDRNDEDFCFDSQAEKEWITKLLKLKKHKLIKRIEIDNDEIFLIGKNFLEKSEIKFEYYSYGRHYSYPDFVMKDNQDRIHLFEVKSLNDSNALNIDRAKYNEKVNALKLFYTEVSKKTPHYYYLPIKKLGEWTVWVMKDGKAKAETFDDFVEMLMK